MKTDNPTTPESLQARLDEMIAAQSLPDYGARIYAVALDLLKQLQAAEVANKSKDAELESLRLKEGRGEIEAYHLLVEELEVPPNGSLVGTVHALKQQLSDLRHTRELDNRDRVALSARARDAEDMALAMSEALQDCYPLSPKHLWNAADHKIVNALTNSAPLAAEIKAWIEREAVERYKAGLTEEEK